jgi:hypothetical protein
MDGFVMERLGSCRANYLIARTPICHLVSSIHLCCSMLKKVAGIALTSLATLRHTRFVSECVHCERVLAQPMTSE